VDLGSRRNEPYGPRQNDALRSLIGMAKALGLLEEPIPTKPSQELTDEMIGQLSDEELDQFRMIMERHLEIDRTKPGHYRADILPRRLKNRILNRAS
jgi:hypothetical protein